MSEPTIAGICDGARAPPMQEPPIRIAMWSGPRNISTAMMRSFGARADTAVIDEPFYGAYLLHTGLVHPMREEMIASQPHDWRDVVTELRVACPETSRSGTRST